MERKEKAIKAMESWIELLLVQPMFNASTEKEMIGELYSIKRDVEKPLEVLIIGEFNAGKSTFINALLGDEILISDVTPATAIITKLTYGPKKKLRVYFHDQSIREYPLSSLSQMTFEKDLDGERGDSEIEVVELQLPLNILKSYTLIDSPGLTSLNQKHTAVTEAFLRKTDAAVWLFNSMNVGTAAEVAWLKKFNDFNLPVRGLINGIDRLDDEEDLEAFYQYHERRLTPYITRLTGISARDLLEGRMTGNHQLMEWGNQAGLNEIFSELLDEQMEHFYEQLLQPLESYQNLIIKNSETLKYAIFREELITSLENEGSILLHVSEKILLEKKKLDKRIEEWNSKIYENSLNLGNMHWFVQVFEENREYKSIWQQQGEPKLRQFTERTESIQSQIRKLKLYANLKEESYKKIDRVFLKLIQSVNYFMAEQDYNKQLDEIKVNLEFLENDYAELQIILQTFNPKLEMIIEEDVQPLRKKIKQLYEVWYMHLESFRENGLKWKVEETQEMELFLEKFSLFKEGILSYLVSNEKAIRTASQKQVDTVIRDYETIHINYRKSELLETYFNVLSLEMTKEVQPSVNTFELDEEVTKYAAYKKQVPAKLNRTVHFQNLGLYLLKEPGIAGGIFAVLSTLF